MYVSLLSSEDGSLPTFQSVLLPSYLEFWTKEQVTPSSEPFRFPLSSWLYPQTSMFNLLCQEITFFIEAKVVFFKNIL
jgi:hypothetical protein